MPWAALVAARVTLHAESLGTALAGTGSEAVCLAGYPRDLRAGCARCTDSGFCRIPRAGLVSRIRIVLIINKMILQNVWLHGPHASPLRE